MAAALKLKDRLTPGDLVVVLIPDSGRGYLSRVYNDEWMAAFGFTKECDECIAAVLDAKGESANSLLYVNPTHTVRAAIDLMRANGVSQLPVCKNTPPFAAAEVAGSIDELALMDAIYRRPAVTEMLVRDVMGPKLPMIGIGQKVSTAVDLMATAPALLVLAGGRPVAILSRTDVLNYLEHASHG